MVTEPVRLHVAAKRYLCAIEPGYFGQLSEASVYTLSSGRADDGAGGAASSSASPTRGRGRLRRWDDQAKDPAADEPGFEHTGRCWRPCCPASKD